MEIQLNALPEYAALLPEDSKGRCRQLIQTKGAASWLWLLVVGLNIQYLGGTPERWLP